LLEDAELREGTKPLALVAETKLITGADPTTTVLVVTIIGTTGLVVVLLKVTVDAVLLTIMTGKIVISATITEMTAKIGGSATTIVATVTIGKMLILAGMRESQNAGMTRGHVVEVEILVQIMDLIEKEAQTDQNLIRMNREGMSDEGMTIMMSHEEMSDEGMTVIIQPRMTEVDETVSVTEEVATRRKRIEVQIQAMSLRSQCCKHKPRHIDL
jgi:hypothetical protein